MIKKLLKKYSVTNKLADKLAKEIVNFIAITIYSLYTLICIQWRVSKIKIKRFKIVAIRNNIYVLP